MATRGNCGASDVRADNALRSQCVAISRTYINSALKDKRTVKTGANGLGCRQLHPNLIHQITLNRLSGLDISDASALLAEGLLEAGGFRKGQWMKR